MEYPDGWAQEKAWNQAYNYGSPFYAYSYYSTPSSETTNDTGTVGTINDIAGTASNLSNAVSGVSKLLSSLWNTDSSYTGGTGSGLTADASDFLTNTDYTSWLKGDS